MNDAELSQASSEHPRHPDAYQYGEQWGPDNPAPGSPQDSQPRPPELADPTFVILWNDGMVTTGAGRVVSEMYNMADCDAMEGVKTIFAVNEKCELVPVKVGKSHRINQDQEDAFYYASAPIMAGTRQVGAVTFTDH